MSSVSIVKCQDYDRARVDAAVRKSVELIGGIGAFVKPGNVVLLKVNLLMPKKPEEAVTTHPEVVRAVVGLVREAGGKPIIGDGSGSACSTADALRESGMDALGAELGVEIVNFEKTGMYKIAAEPPSGKVLKELFAAKPVVDSDVVISMCKLKTHMLTLYTGAVKNFYGALPSTMKRTTHYIATSSQQFSEAVVDVYSVIDADLAIMDGIIGMEGTGPSGGKPINSAVVVAGADCVSVDAVCASIMGIEPFAVNTTRIAAERGLGEGGLKNIEVVGENIDGVKMKFKLPSGYFKILDYVPQGFAKLGKTASPKKMPFFIEEKCIKCKKCEVACPAQAIHVGKKGEANTLDRKKCVLCYCCHEMCPEKAIALKRRIPAFQK